MPRRFPLSLLDARLDPAQRALVEHPAGGALLVLGEAGHGKTTVALHRLAHLRRLAPARFRAVVLVPHEGLRRLVEPVLVQLGADVPVRTYDGWARRQARRAFPDLPRRERAARAVVVARAKRHPALRAQLLELARNPLAAIDADPDQAPTRRADLQLLFGDRTRIERLVRAARLPEHAVAELLDHTRRQFSLRTEQVFSHVFDRARLRALDGRRIDDGTLDEVAGSVDAEDYAILFELDRLRGTPTHPSRFDCIVLDEAQELAPLELALIGRSLAAGGTLIVAGDADQRSDLATGFTDWHSVMHELGVERYESAQLEVSYRCPPDVVRLARTLRSEGVAKSAEDVPYVRRHADQAALVHALADQLRSGVVLTRSHLAARRLAEQLRGHLPVRHVLDGRFLPRGPLQIATIDDVRGLEFDVVAIADADSETYPADEASKRALYVGVTRARRRLFLACSGAASPLLRDDGEPGRRESC